MSGLLNNPVMDFIRHKMSQINALKNRERFILCFATIIIMYALWNNIFYRPVQQEIKKQNTSIQHISAQIEAIDQEMHMIAEELETQEGEGAEDLSTRAELVEHAKVLDTRLGIVTSDLVSPEQMIRALHTMLERQKGLQLLSLDTSPATQLSAEVPEQPRKKSGKKSNKKRDAVHMVIPGIYKHEITIVLLGDYFSTLNYLTSLEHLGWRLFWDSLDYQVIDYPTAQIKITLHTLSSEKGFIGGE